MEFNGTNLEDAEAAEKLFVLAAYVFIDSSRRLFGYSDHAHESWLGVELQPSLLS
jgi:hypothetical protein